MLKAPNIVPIRLAKSMRFAGLYSLVFAATVLGSTVFLPSKALADFKVCNDTESLTGVAIGYRETSGWVMEGWWRIPAGVCASLIEGDLSSRYFYLYAEDADTGGQWRGPVFMCTSSKEFRIEGLKNCFARGYERTGFFEIDTESQKNWQVRLTEANRTKTKEKTSQ